MAQTEMEAKGPIHIALAANHVYLPGLKATFVSLITASADKNRLRFHVFSEGLSDVDQDEIRSLGKRFGYGEPIDFRYPDMSVIKENFTAYKESYSPYMRLCFPESFPDLDWVLWSDSDVLWFRDPAELWDERDASVSLMWGREPPAGRAQAKIRFERHHSGFDQTRYCCSGILLMNLSKLRSIGLIEKCTDFVRHWGVPLLSDQDLLNEICYDDARIIDDSWGCYNPVYDLQKGVVLHCSGISLFFDTLDYHGKWPMWALWFRYYREIVLGEKNVKVCSFAVRCLFYVCGLFRFPSWVFRLASGCLSVEHSDMIRCAMYYSWLSRKKLW